MRTQFNIFHQPVRRNDFGEHEYFGSLRASSRTHKRYLRTNKLGKFANVK